MHLRAIHKPWLPHFLLDQLTLENQSIWCIRVITILNTFLWSLRFQVTLKVTWFLLTIVCHVKHYCKLEMIKVLKKQMRPLRWLNMYLDDEILINIEWLKEPWTLLWFSECWVSFWTSIINRELFKNRAFKVIK